MCGHHLGRRMESNNTADKGVSHRVKAFGLLGMTSSLRLFKVLF